VIRNRSKRVGEYSLKKKTNQERTYYHIKGGEGLEEKDPNCRKGLRKPD